MKLVLPWQDLGGFGILELGCFFKENVALWESCSDPAVSSDHLRMSVGSLHPQYWRSLSFVQKQRNKGSRNILFSVPRS